MNAGMKDMLNVMSKFFNMGMSLDEVIARLHLASGPRDSSRGVGKSLGGCPGRHCRLRLVEGDFGFVDSARLRMRGDSETGLRR